jgi:hypothetical protein
VAVFLVAAAVAATALFGVLPAMYATRLDPPRAVHGEIVRNARPGRARYGLIVVQVTASALLLICAGVLLRGVLRSVAADPGLRTEDTIIIEFGERARAALVEAVVAEPAVSAVAASWPGAPTLSPARAGFASPAGAGRVPVRYRFVSPEYFGVFDIDVLKGRAFTPEEGRTGAAVAMVSDVMAGQLWPDGDGVGQVLRLEPDPIGASRYPDSSRSEPALSSQSFVVIGVVRAVPGFRMGWPDAGVYVPTSPTKAEMTLIARVRGDFDAGRRALSDRLTSIDPNLHQLLSMSTVVSLETYPLQVGFWTTIVLGGLALTLTVSGIFSVLSYLVEQRTRELGVRIALGATTGAVGGLVLRQSLRLAGIGLAAGTGLAWALAAVLMSLPVAGNVSRFVNVFDPAAYAGSLLMILAACSAAALAPARRATRIDPAVALRRE